MLQSGSLLSCSFIHTFFSSPSMSCYLTSIAIKHLNNFPKTMPAHFGLQTYLKYFLNVSRAIHFFSFTIDKCYRYIYVYAHTYYPLTFRYINSAYLYLITLPSHLSTDIFVYISIYLSIYQPIYLSIYLSIYCVKVKCHRTRSPLNITIKL